MPTPPSRWYETGKKLAFVFWNSFRGEKWPARSFFDQREETSSCTAETVANNIKGWIGEEENGDVLGNLVVWLAALFYFILFLCRRCWKYIRREARRCLFSSQVCQQPKWRRLKGCRVREREKKGQTRNNNKHSNQISQQPTTPAPFWLNGISSVPRSVWAHDKIDNRVWEEFFFFFFHF